MSTRASARAVAVLSVAASLTLHAAALGLIVRWSISPDTPPLPLIQRGDGGIEVRMRAPRPSQPELEPAREPLPMQLAVLPPSTVDVVSIPAPPSALDVSEKLASSPPPSPSPPASSEPAIVREPQEVPPLPSRLEDPFPSGGGGAQTGTALRGKLEWEYPASCKRLRHEGTTTIECDVDASGRVTSAQVIQSAGCEDLDRAALEAVRRATFSPARQGGVAVPSRVIQPVTCKAAS